MTSGGALVSIKQEIPDEETNSSIHPILLPPAKIKREFVVNVKQEQLSESELLSEIKCEINYESTLASIDPDVSVKLEEPTLTQISTAPDEVPIKKSKTEKSILTKYTCSCNKVFYDEFQHFRHMLDHTIENMTRVKCYICDRYFKTRNGMIAHVYSEHIEYRCKVCIWRFPTNNMLMEHMELYHSYFVPRGPNPYSKMNKAYLRQMWEEKYRRNDSQMYSSTIHGTKHYPHLKTEPTYNNAEFGRITNVKTEPYWHVNTEPTYSNTEPIYPNVKFEPSYYPNVNVEPTNYPNIKVEATNYYSNVNSEPTRYSNVKIEPGYYYSNVSSEPTRYSNVKIEPGYYSNVNVEPPHYSNVKIEPSSYYSNVNVEPTNYSNVKVEPSYDY